MLRLLWVGLTMSVVVLFALLAIVTMNQPAPGHYDPLVGYELAGLGAALALVSIVLPRILFGRALGALDLPTEAQVGEAIGGFRESAPVTRVLANADASMERVLTAYQQPFVVGMALAEAVAFFGFQVGYMSHEMKLVAPFFAVALMLQASKFPRLDRVMAAVERVTGARVAL